MMSIAVQTAVVDVMASGEFCNARRRIAHLLTMYGFVIYAVTTVIMVFAYPTPATPPTIADRLESLQRLAGRPVERFDDSMRDAFETALPRGRAVEAKPLIEAAHAALRDTARLADEFIRPVMERIGHDWGMGALDVFQEHRASRIVESTLGGLIARAAARPVEPGAPVALGATPEGDIYTLSGLLCELALRDLGWDVVNLGPNLPMASLAKAVRVHRPQPGLALDPSPGGPRAVRPRGMRPSTTRRPRTARRSAWADRRCRPRSGGG